MESDLTGNATESAAKSKHPRQWRRAIVTTSVVCGMLFSVVAVAPTAVMNSSYRNSLLNQRLQERGLTAVSAAGSGSWLTPIQFHDLTIEDETGSIRCSIRSVQTSKSLIGLILNGGDLGTFTIVEPAVSLALDDNGNLPEALTRKSPDPLPDDAIPDMAFVVQDAALTLTAPWRPVPIVEVQQLDLSGNITTDNEGRWLTLDPVQIFDHEILTDAHTQQNVALIAPVLSKTTALQGEVSVRLDGFRHRLDAQTPGPVPIAGVATFHSVEAKLRPDWAAQVTQFIGGATGQQVPQRLEVVRDSSVAFHVDDDGVHHEGLALLLPELGSRMQIESSGVVGLDERLDLKFRLHFPQSLPGSGLFTGIVSKMLSGPMTLFVKGTVSEPKLEAPPGFSVVDQLSHNLDPNSGDSPPSVVESVMKLVGSAASPDPQSGEKITGSILNMIQAARQAKAAREAKRAQDADEADQNVLPDDVGPKGVLPESAEHGSRTDRLRPAEKRRLRKENRRRGV
ncbi:MAG: hypothetical protein R3C59_06785 [Planctomycetaceae bacterium]